MHGIEAHPQRRGARPTPNAICVGGPCDGMLTRIEQDIGVVQVSFGLDGHTQSARYLITLGRVHHPSRPDPFTVLIWVDDSR